MSVYALLLVDAIHDPDGYTEYERSHDRAVLEAHGGEILIKSEDPEILEGHWRHQRVVLISFPSRAEFHGWYDSEHYVNVRALRLAASTGRMVCFDGYARTGASQRFA
jgi:uncharacterized protein (DUF1330 family)